MSSRIGVWVFAFALAGALPALGGCGAGATPVASAPSAVAHGAAAATTPASTPTSIPTVAPWHVIADDVATQTENTPAYVSAAAGRPLLVTAPTISGRARALASGVISRVAADAVAGTSPSTVVAAGILPSRAVVGVIRAPGGIDRVITLRATYDGTATGLAISTLSPDGFRLSHTTSLPTTLPSIDAVAFSQSASGNVVLAWAEGHEGTGDDFSHDALKIRVATGENGVFSSYRTLFALRGSDADVIPELAVAVNAAGKAVVASDVGPHAGVSSWIGGVSGGGVLAPVVAKTPTAVGPLRAAMTSTGRTVLAWRESNEDAMDPHGRVTVYAATIAPGSQNSSTTQVVDRGPVDYPSATGLDLIAGSDGRATLVFSAEIKAGGNQSGYVTDLGATGRFGKPRVLVTDGSVGGLAVRADGTQIVTLVASPSDSAPLTIQTRLRAPGETSFAPAETVGGIPSRVRIQVVTSQPQFALSPPPDAPIPTFDPSTGRPVIAWTVEAPHGSTAGQVIVVARDRP